METRPVDASGAVPRLGPYRLHGVLGEGGMGVVHLGVDDAGRAVAVKVLRDHVAHDPVARARLAREVATLRRVDHPAVAPVLGADVDGPRPYLVTRYVPGEPLDVWVREHGPLAGEALRSFGLTLVEALEAIHAAGVVHRDLKPGNVLMPSGSPVVIDFGIAHVADESRLTSTGLVMGTPGYLAPELLDGQEVSAGSDVWGFGATFLFAATGRPPFGGGPTPAVLDRVHRGALDVEGVEPWVADLCRSLLDPHQDRRPSTADLRLYLSDPRRTLPVTASGSHALPPQGAAGTPRPVEAESTIAVPAPARPAAVDPRPTSAEEGPRTRIMPSVGGPAALRGDAGRPSSPRHEPPATTAHPVVSTRMMPAVPPPPEREVRPRTDPAYAGFASPRPAGPGVPPGGQPPVAVAPSGAVVPGAGPRPVSRRSGTLLAAGVALVALTAYLPVLGFLVGLGWSWLTRFVERTSAFIAMRRMERGPRDRDVPLAVLMSPGHLVGAALSALVAAVLPLFVGTAFAFGLSVLTGDVSGTPLGTASTLAIGAAAALIVAWWGPGGSTMRRGSRSVVRTVAPGRLGARVVSSLLLVAAVVWALLTQASGYELSWWPLTDAPWAPLRGLARLLAGFYA